MKVFIAGKISGDPAYRRKFRTAENALRSCGFSVMNPARLGNYAAFTHRDYLHITRAMLERCDAVVLLPDWQESSGAKEEAAYAETLGKHVYSGVNELIQTYVGAFNCARRTAPEQHGKAE